MELDFSVIARLIAIGVLIVLSAFFSGSETALFSLSKLQLKKLKEKDSWKFKTILRLLSKPQKLLITILFGNEIVNISISAISASLVITFFAGQFESLNPKWLNILIVVPFLLLFGEVLPKTIAIKNNEGFANFISLPLHFFGLALYPIVFAVSKISKIVIRAIAGEYIEDKPIMEEEFISLMEHSYESGVIREREKALIHRVFKLGNSPLSKIMTPRGSIFSLPYDMPFKKMIAQVSELRHSAVPIYKESNDRIVGILYTKSILDLSEEDKDAGEKTLDKILQEPLFIPATKNVYDLFREFQFKKNQIAIILDEFGGVIGLLTLSDLLEEVFGKIDGREVQDELIKREKENCWIIAARMELVQLSKTVGVTIKSEEFETIGGFVFNLFGKLPTKGQSINYNNLKFTVTEIDITRIVEVKLEILAEGLEEK